MGEGSESLAFLWPFATALRGAGAIAAALVAWFATCHAAGAGMGGGGSERLG